ncbi:E3 ubiquitin-protein ligase TRIM21-like [Cololabis saira]|uniref:E3 ubiquitin-protein ligase TRIM21-like n=1 Tax=Cololabis saira TaxID=129043 RepID=UPI002AD3F50D|nr:E3 ubiquitin-protein ligase TRIM21-like [Cololabis saira]XP_061570896.1 E3 ubiquitin-protein ligase TRIM21-like [Cololabis saira]
MAKLSLELWSTLQELTEDEFSKFKWMLKQEDVLKGQRGIPVSLLECADRQDTVDLMVGKYRRPGALQLTTDILELIGRNDLRGRLQNFCQDEKDFKNDRVEKETDKVGKKAELKRVKRFAVDVTLDPDTAHPDLVLSDDGKQVYRGDVTKKLPKSSRRFDSCVSVLGEQRFSSGRFYFEVQVKGKTAWTIGVVRKSINRKGTIMLQPQRGFWTMYLTNGDDYKAIENPAEPLILESPLEVLGVFVDYEEGLVSFYNVDTADLLYSFTECDFTEKLLPYFCPCSNKNGDNSAPLIISDI